MFRTILVKEEQRPLQRILWRDSKSEPLKCIQLKTVTYGTKCAPYLACRTLRMLAGQHKEEYPEAADIIESECYMDDFLSGADTLDQAQQVCSQLIEVLQKGNFVLHKWTTNEPQLLTNAVSTNDDTVYDFTPSAAVKTLGVKWLPQSDALTTAIPELQQFELTKRNILSAIAKIYDPIGILAPTVIIAKILMQDIWKAKIDWDMVIPEDLQRTWLEFQANLPELKNINVPRYYFSDIPTWITLIGFSDASAKTFGAVVYFRATYPNKEPTCSLVMAKTRKANIKDQIARDDGKRPDGMSLIPGRMGRALVWDATCADTLAASYISATTTSKQARAAANYEFITCGVESLGLPDKFKDILKCQHRFTADHNG
ncbi:uncharacterized protein LOC134795195 [Cydia splendana]|uniref:uncharacterized protein LOC134795195 n=1 Tax=Cydia splendana TaxID=1100963 RepID=UPI00300D1649